MNLIFSRANYQLLNTCKTSLLHRLSVKIPLDSNSKISNYFCQICHFVNLLDLFGESADLRLAFGLDFELQNLKHENYYY